MTNKVPIILIFLFVVNSQRLSAETTSLAFLKLGSGARAQGLANAYAAITGDINAIAYNPAGINGIRRNEASLTHARLSSDLNYNFAGYGMIFKKSVIGLAVNYLSNTQIEGRGTNREATGSFSANDTAVNMAYGRKLSDKLGCGLNIKYIKSEIQGTSAKAYAFDIGSAYETQITGLNIGISIQNIGTKIKYLDQANSLPLTIRTGTSYAVLGNVLLNIEADRHIHERKTTISLGTEYTIFNNISIRAGYLKDFGQKDIKTENGINAGFGLKMNRFTFEYSTAPFGELGNSQRLSLGIKF